MELERIYRFGDVVADNDLVFAESLKPSPPVLLIFFPKSNLSIPLSDKERKKDGQPKRRAKRHLKVISVVHLEGKAAEAMSKLYSLSVEDEEIDYRFLIDFLRACFLCGVGLGMRLAAPPSILEAFLNLGEETLLTEVVPKDRILFLRQENDDQKEKKYTHIVFFPGASIADLASQDEKNSSPEPELAWFNLEDYPIENLLSILGTDNLSALLINIFVAGESHGFGQAATAMNLLRNPSPAFP